jgi:hypothetical protein
MYLHQINGTLRADTIAHFREVALTRGGAAHLQGADKPLAAQPCVQTGTVPLPTMAPFEQHPCVLAQAQPGISLHDVLLQQLSFGRNRPGRQAIQYSRACACVRVRARVRCERVHTVAVVALLIGLDDAVAALVGAKHGCACSGGPRPFPHVSTRRGERVPVANQDCSQGTRWRPRNAFPKMCWPAAGALFVKKPSLRCALTLSAEHCDQRVA